MYNIEIHFTHGRSYVMKDHGGFKYIHISSSDKKNAGKFTLEELGEFLPTLAGYMDIFTKIEISHAEE